MLPEASKKPIDRSRLRLWLGKNYFTFKRYFLWLFGGLKFSTIRTEILPFECFCHKTPLLRKLKDVDMYLQYNKIENLKIAVPKINNMTIKPGETFSYWKAIGKSTKRKGYLKGLVLQNGTFTAGIGGGLCQLSNLIYWLTIHTPLTVTERHRHGYDVFPDSNRTQPFGSGATCFYNYGDLMIANNTEQTFQLVVEITETDLKGAWLTDKPPQYTYEVYEREHFMQAEFWGGYTRHNLLYRKKYDLEGTVIDDEYIVENHAIMTYAPFLPDPTK
ncbi:MAG: VanW family protein [Eggerthellaceae bacterium]|jgi:vancomycin resistance protein VanW|nr:VanW family protein [Eggerthellaceae bacterium]MDR2721742.1 VanW family protein [Coriobacteriaceae bacterium]